MCAMELPKDTLVYCLRKQRLIDQLGTDVAGRKLKLGRYRNHQVLGIDPLRPVVVTRYQTEFEASTHFYRSRTLPWTADASP